MSQSQDAPTRKRIARGDTIRTSDGQVAVVVKVGIGLGEDGSGTEIIRAVVDLGDDQQAVNLFAAACEVIAHNDGATMPAARASDTSIASNGDTMPTVMDDLLSEEELERLTDPDGNEAIKEN